MAFQLWCEEGNTSVESRRIYERLRLINGWEDRKYLAGFATASKCVTALQGADLVAREAFKHADNRGVRHTRRPVRELKNRMSFHVWNRACLEHLRDHGGPEDSETLISWGRKKPPEVPVMTRYYREGFDD
jgi:hypothetical protein